MIYVKTKGNMLRLVEQKYKWFGWEKKRRVSRPCEENFRGPKHIPVWKWSRRRLETRFGRDIPHIYKLSALNSVFVSANKEYVYRCILCVSAELEQMYVLRITGSRNHIHFVHSRNRTSVKSEHLKDVLGICNFWCKKVIRKMLVYENNKSQQMFRNADFKSTIYLPLPMSRWVRKVLENRNVGRHLTTLPTILRNNPSLFVILSLFLPYLVENDGLIY